MFLLRDMYLILNYFLGCRVIRKLFKQIFMFLYIFHKLRSFTFLLSYYKLFSLQMSLYLSYRLILFEQFICIYQEKKHFFPRFLYFRCIYGSIWSVQTIDFLLFYCNFPVDMRCTGHST